MENKINSAVLSNIQDIINELGKVVIGQKDVINKVLIAFFSEGHVLLEGVPGLAKTHLLKNFARVIKCEFERIQFTPDLLPADIIGTMIYNPKNMVFEPSFGPIFHNIILADEINRAPSKVQSALLQAMAEYEVNLGGKNYPLERPFYVLATQNPIEHEGTYSLPEAQLDRFMFKILIDYPTIDEEISIINLIENPEGFSEIKPLIEHKDLAQILKEKNNVYIDEKLKKYIAEIVFSSRYPKDYKLSHIADYIEWGASPRATINLIKASKVVAMMNNRNFVLPEDIKYIANDVLRHRIVLTYEALAENITPDFIINEILENRMIP